jgi:hypothetical protein
MIKEFHLDPKDHAEVLRIHNLYSDRNEDNEYEMVKSNLREFKRLAKTYPFPSLFHSLKSKYFDIGVIERYKNGDLAKANYCLSMSARCGFLMDIIGGKDYSGGYDCLHVYSMLLAASCGDFACVDRCLDVFPGPAKSGHLSSVILCNGLCDALKRKSSMGLRGIVDKRKDTKYYMAMFNALIAIMDGSRPLFLSSVRELLKHQRRQSHLMYLEKVFCSNAHALCRIWSHLHQTKLEELTDNPLWDEGLYNQRPIETDDIKIKFEKEFPVFCTWITSLPHAVNKEELLNSL